MMKKALVVLSGGQDSTTCLFHAIDRHGVENVHAISFDYGQRHRIELEAAAKVATLAGIADWPEGQRAFPLGLMQHSSARHEFLGVFGLLNSVSPLTSDTELAKYENFDQMAEEVGSKVEKTFVPMRNSLFLIIAANRAVELGCEVIYTGICQADNANYPDCTEKFRHKMELAINVSLDPEQPYIAIRAPLMYMSKAESVKHAMTLPGCMDALAYSHTSYDGRYPPDDMNHSNVLRAKGFEEAGVPDPLVVRAWNDRLMELPNTANYDKLRDAQHTEV